MKRFYPVWLFFILVFAACEKNNNDPSHIYTASEIEGKWKLAVDNGKDVFTDSRGVYTFNSDYSVTLSCLAGSEGVLEWDSVYKRKGTFSIIDNVLSISLADSSVPVKWLVRKIADNTFEFETFAGEVAPKDGAISKLERVTADYSNAIIGLWEGVALEGESDYGDENHRWGYMKDGSYVYYTKEGDSWVESSNVFNRYYLDGNLLISMWIDNEGISYYENWDIESCDDNQMVWTALRQKADGTTYGAKLVMNKIQ